MSLSGSGIFGRDRNIPLLCRGGSRPVPYIEHSRIVEEGRFYILCSCLDGKAQLRCGKTGDWIGTFVGHKGAVWMSTFNRNASLVATGSADYTAKVWDCISGKELLSLDHAKVVKSVAFSPDGTQLLTAGMEGILRLYDLNEYDAAPRQLLGHDGSVKSAIWMSEERNILVSGGNDKKLRLWDVRSGEVTKEIETPGAVTSIKLASDGVFLTTTAGREVKFWHTAKMERPVRAFTCPIEVNSAALHPDASRFVLGGDDLNVRVFDAVQKQLRELELHRGHHGPVHSVSFAPDGHTYASSSEDGTVRIWQNKVEVYELWQEGGARLVEQKRKEEEKKKQAEEEEAAAAAAAEAAALEEKEEEEEEGGEGEEEGEEEKEKKEEEEAEEKEKKEEEEEEKDGEAEEEKDGEAEEKKDGEAEEKDGEVATEEEVATKDEGEAAVVAEDDVAASINEDDAATKKESETTKEADEGKEEETVPPQEGEEPGAVKESPDAVSVEEEKAESEGVDGKEVSSSEVVSDVSIDSESVATPK